MLQLLILKCSNKAVSWVSLFVIKMVQLVINLQHSDTHQTLRLLLRIMICLINISVSWYRHFKYKYFIALDQFLE